MALSKAKVAQFKKATASQMEVQAGMKTKGKMPMSQSGTTKMPQAQSGTTKMPKGC